MTLEFGNLLSADHICGEDEEETLELRKMLDRARLYLQSYTWCEAVSDEHLGFGVGGVLAVFLVRTRLRTGSDELLWVVDGDFPSAYFVVDRARSAATALEIYAELMEAWVRAVRRGADLRDVFPVAAPADEEHAAMLESRIKFLRDELIPAAHANA